MIAIITRQNADGTYDQVGMRNRRVSAEYKSVGNLCRYAFHDNDHGKFRLELYANREAIYGEPYRVTEISR